MSNREETKDAARIAAGAAVEASRRHTRLILRVIVIVLAVALAIYILYKLTGLILLLILSVFFAYLVHPLVELVKRPIKLFGREWKVPHILAISLSYLIILTALIVALSFLVPRLRGQFPEFVEQVRGYWQTLGAKTQDVRDFLRLHRLPAPVLEAVNRMVGFVSSMVESVVASLAYAHWLVLIPILSFFLLKDAETFRRSALQMLPRGRWRWRGDEFFQDINMTLAAYVRAQLTACLFIGVVCTIAFALLGLPSPLILGFIAGVFEFVPLVGPLMVAVIAAIGASLSLGTFNAFLVLLFLGILRVVQDYFIYPRLVGQGIHLHPLAIIIAILAGAELGGVAGIFLSIPAVAILTVSYRHWLEHRGSEGFADLLESTPAGEAEAPADWSIESSVPTPSHPSVDTTPDEMVRARPDLTTGELKMPADT